ncbi:MAG: SRPBCC family protein [Chitinophagales bacterium]|nr:SRPBCC family protein [Chitinophagales bacterium]
MKALKIVLLVILSLILLITIAGFIMPRQMHVEYTGQVNAPIDQVYRAVSDLRTWGKWDAWSKNDPEQKVTFEGPDGGVGQIRKWEGKKNGEGSMTIVSTRENQEMVSELDFGFGGKPTSTIYFVDKGGNATEVRWVMDNDLGMNPFVRLMMGMFKGAMVNDFKTSLEGLDTYLKTNPTTASNNTVAKPQVIDLQEQWFATVSKKNVAFDNISESLGSMYGSIGAFLAQSKVEPTGPPSAFYTNYNIEKRMMDIEAALPISGKIDAKNGILVRPLGHKKAVMLEYHGAYDKMDAAHDQLQAYITDNKLTIVGAPWETYVSDPMMEKDTSKWLTNIYYPVQ